MQSVKRLIENWIGAAPAAPGEDTQWTWRFHLGWPDWVLVLFAAAAAAFVVYFYLREGAAARSAKLFLASVRLLIIALLIVMLGELELSIDRTGLPYLVVGIDDSESQSLRRRDSTPSAADEDEAPTHQQRVLAWLSKDGGEQLKSLLDRYKLRFYAFSGSVRRIGDDVLNADDLDRALVEVRKLTAKGGDSAIGGAVREIVNDLRGAPPAAMIVPTDGVVTAGEPLSQAAAFAARKQVSLFTIGAGDPEKPRDLELTDLLVDDTVFVGDDVTFEAKVIGRGLAGKDVPVSLKSPNLRQPITQTVHIDADNKPIRVRLTYRPRQEGEQKPGAYRFTIETPTIERETNKDNNKLDRQVTFVDERVRVLLVDAGPRYEMRFLKQLLDRQSSMEVRVLLWDADPEFVQQDRAAIGFFPTKMEDLAKYDVVVLGDVKPSIFSQAQIEFIKNFVKRGGGLMVVAGPSYAPQTFKDSALEDLLPIRLGSGSGDRPATNGPFRPKVSPEGATSPVLRFDADDAENNRIWASLPPMFWYSPAEKAKPAAQVLLEHPTEMGDGKPLPLLVSQFYGGGRTLFQAFDGTWRWRYQVEDLYHARYWIQAMRFLSRTKLLGKNRFAEIAVDRLRVRRGEPVQVRVQYLDESKAPTDEGVSAVVERTGRLGTRTTVDLKRSPSRRDVFEGVYTQTDDGEYRVRLAATGQETLNQTARFTVLPPPGELDNVQLNEEDLRAAAKASGGRYFPLDEADQVFADGVLPFGRRVALNSEAPLALWRTWPTLLLFASFLLIEWLVRKRMRLV